MLIGLVKTRNNTTRVGRFIFEKILSGCYAARPLPLKLAVPSQSYYSQTWF